MIDVGHPFSKPFQELVEDLTESLQSGVEQPASQELLFRSSTLSYALRPIGGPISRLADQISGFVAGRPAIFDLGRHYSFSLGQLVWQALPAIVDPDAAATWFPDDNSRLSVGYFFRDLPSGITDFNDGSVAATLVRATARELKLLYEQMDQAYRRAFIDYAQGAGLDNVVALLGIARNQALPAQGEVTFSLKRPPRNDVAIGAGVRVADARGRTFKVTSPGVIKAATAQTQLTLPVVALETGPEGNLGSGSLTVMPTPPRGFDGVVTNDAPLTGGEAAESDEQLRERAKHALERAGNATLNAIRFAVLNIDGVDSVEIRDFSVDETIPLGEVWVRFSTGQSALVTPRVHEVVENTRAAGIKPRVSEVSTVLLSGKAFVIPDAADGGRDALARYKAALVAALASLGIGTPVSPRKLGSLVFQVPGLADVAEIQLEFRRGADPAAPVDTDPFVVDAGEQARPDENLLEVLSVQALSVSAAALAADGSLSLSVSALDDAGNPIAFRAFELALLATIRAKPSASPNQPLQQVAQVSGRVRFDHASAATAELSPVNIPNLASLDPASIEVSVQAAAYPGVAAGSGALTV